MTNNQSRKALQWLHWMEYSLNITTTHAGRLREKRLPEGPLVDGFSEATDGQSKGHVWDFRGCYFHGCQRCYRVNRDTCEDAAKGGESMDDRYQRTMRIADKIRRSGYILHEMWECDFDRECASNERLKEFINSNKKLWYTVPLDPRDAFYGGRTDNTVKVYDIKNGERIKYIDVCSLYHYICKYGKYPIGHPKIYVGKEECKKLVACDNNTGIYRVEGLIKCEVLPPRNLFHPVLPVKMHNKLLFPLFRTCVETKCQDACAYEDPDDRAFVGTWVADEVKVAVQYGYTIREIYEIWQYQVKRYDPNTRKGGLFHEYIDTFFVEKMHASGFPSDCQSPEQFVEEFERQEGVKINMDRMAFNPGLRSVAKLCLNSLWGKFGQRENRPQTEVVTEPQRLFELLTSPDTEVNSILPVDDNVIYVSWSYKEEALKPSPHVNVVVAAYTTALARLKLLDEMMKLGERVLYTDTDSIVYVSKNGEYDTPIGPHLGDFTDELSSYGAGTYIDSFISGGPKFYAMELVKPDGTKGYMCKIKGIRLNHSAFKKLNFASIRKLVTGEIPPLFVTYDAIRRTDFHDVVTKTETKICDAVFEKRRFVGLNKSYPYGYK